MNFNKKLFDTIILILLIISVIVGSYFIITKKPLSTAPQVLLPTPENQVEVSPAATTTVQFPNDNEIEAVATSPVQTPVTQKPPATIPAQEISNIFQSNARGCGNIFVYKTNQDDTTGISVDADLDKLKLSTTSQTFNLGEVDGLEVELLIGLNSGIRGFYCNDVDDGYTPDPTKMFGKKGQVTITITDFDRTAPVWDRNYNATVILNNIDFMEENGVESSVTVDHLLFEDVRVGWLPG